jgi:hypothetical protein
MTKLKKVWGVGLMLVGATFACTPQIRELGDEPGAGGDGGGPSGAGGSGGKAGSESVLPKGGSKSSPGGAAGSGPADAGAPPTPGECFSPSDHLELALDPDAVGCECNGNELTCVTATDGDVPWFGAALECVDGRWKIAPGGCDRGCFSPTDSPELALEPDGVGCACSDEPPQCVRTTYQSRPWDVALYCVGGRWTIAEDGVCDWLAPGCKVDDVSYLSGARGIPSPFSACNTCECRDGELVNCTTLECADKTCPEGSSAARRCLGCGPADDCSEYEIGCLSGEGCENGLCASPWCG